MQPISQRCRTPLRILPFAFGRSLSSLQNPVTPSLRLSSLCSLRVPDTPSSAAFIWLQQRCYSVNSRQTSSTGAADPTTVFHSDVPMAEQVKDKSQAWQEEGDDDEDLQVQIFRPDIPPEEAERKAKTDLFLCLLLTLPKAQDWKDMLTAAFRANTWRPHYLDAVLRGVLLNKYNAPQSFLLSCGRSPTAASTRTVSESLREAAVQALQSAPAVSSPSDRLQRAREILTFCAEEGALYSPSHTMAEVQDTPPARPSEAPDTNNEVLPDATAKEAKPLKEKDAFHPSPAAAHHLLAMLLQAAQHGLDHTAAPDATAGTSPSLTTPGTPALPTASYAEVWHYLAWMELHGYHVLSHSVLDALEAAVDEGSSLSRSESHRNSTKENASGSKSKSLSSSFSSSPSISSAPLQYAVVSQRIHRLDYIRSERALLQEALRSKSKMDGGRGGGRRRGQRDVPQTDPAE